MGGGDLNLKKSWHPHTMKNQERVWKAEQKDTEEKKRIAELQREINAERSKEDMQKFAEDTGVVKKKDDIKLEWMYKGPSQSVNHEEYLLGKAVDKNFERYQNEQKNGPSTSQEEEGLPGAVRQAKSSLFSEQVDMARKIQEDPLMAIRQRAIEKAKQLYNNPVKMKQLQKLASLQTSDGKKHKKEKKEKKKHKKSKKKEEEKMLDALLTAKLKNALKDRDLLRKLKKKSRRESSGSSTSEGSSNSEDNFDREENSRHGNSKKEYESKGRENSRHVTRPTRSPSPMDSKAGRWKQGANMNSSYVPKSYRGRSRSPRSSGKRSRSRSRERDSHSSRRYEQEVPMKHKDSASNNRRTRVYSPEASASKGKSSQKKHKRSHRSPSTSDEDNIRVKGKMSKNDDSDSDKNYKSDDESRAKSKRTFGLMMADGSKPVVKTPAVAKQVVAPAPDNKPTTWQRKERVKLTEEEKERRRQEMLQNASWRDQVRVENVKRYRLEEDRERKQLHDHFDDDFARKQFSKAADLSSVEGRIKSKLNTIQRSKVSMDQNFARR